MSLEVQKGLQIGKNEIICTSTKTLLLLPKLAGDQNKGRAIDCLPRESFEVLSDDFDVPSVRGSVGGSLPSVDWVLVIVSGNATPNHIVLHGIGPIGSAIVLGVGTRDGGWHHLGKGLLLIEEPKASANREVVQGSNRLIVLLDLLVRMVVGTDVANIGHHRGLLRLDELESPRTRLQPILHEKTIASVPSTGANIPNEVLVSILHRCIEGGEATSLGEFGQGSKDDVVVVDAGRLVVGNGLESSLGAVLSSVAERTFLVIGGDR